MTEHPIPKYPNPEKLYTLFTGSSNYGCACVLTQVYTHVVDGKEKVLVDCLDVANLILLP